MAQQNDLPADNMSSRYKDELMRLYSKSKSEQYTAEKPAVPQVMLSSDRPPDPFAAAGAVGSRKFSLPDPNSFFSEKSENAPQQPVPESVRQAAEDNASEQPDDKSLTETKATGFVQAEVTTGGSFPVRSAVITVTENVGGKQYIRSILFSDSSGRTEIAELSADAPEGMAYKPYTIRAEASGFYSADNITVPVFPNIRSVQPIDLIPLPEGSGK